MQPLDPRLLKHARAGRKYIAIIATLGVAMTALVIVQSILIATIISPVITGHQTWKNVGSYFWWLAGVVLVRAVLLYLRERYAHRAAVEVIAELRTKVLDHAISLGPRWMSDKSTDLITLTTRGLSDLEPYFVRYLPQLILAVILTPTTVIVIAFLDWLSALIVLFTIPLIPIFMWLIGSITKERSAIRLKAMQNLGTQLLDLIAGLPTLKALGREKGPGNRVGDLGMQYARATMRTLQLAFLSGAVLEFLTTISVALVAVWMGMRLVVGDVHLFEGLAVIMLAPEAFLPIRLVGTQFHASANGVAAARQAFDILDTPIAQNGTTPAPDLKTTDIKVKNLSVQARGMNAPWRISLEISPGTLTVFAGDSGAGKTTAIMCMLQLIPPDEGTVELHTVDGKVLDLYSIDKHSWWEQIIWVPGRPTLLPGSVLANILDNEQAEIPDNLETAAKITGLDQVIARLPQGYHSQLGEGGVGLSIGERQRLALTKVMLGKEQLVILDEPTAHLDAVSEETVLAGIDHLLSQGRTVIVIAHRPAVIAQAEHLVTVVGEKL